MINSSCDMHIHTICSDGELTPTELVEFAHKLNVKYFSITDHDVVDFYLDKEALELTQKYKMKYVTGCEFVCRVGLHPIEILGYGIDVDEAKKYLDKHGVTEEKMQAIRIKYSKKIFKKLGFKISFEGRTYDPVDVIYEYILSHPELKNIFYNENPNLLISPSFILRQGLNNPKSKLFINTKKFYPSYKKIIKIIQKKFNGVAIIAHPLHYANVMEEILQKVVKAGIDGIECYHYTVNTKEKNDYLVNYAKKNNLLISGGSDFHHVSDIEKMRESNMIPIPDFTFKNIYNTIIKQKVK